MVTCINFAMDRKKLVTVDGLFGPPIMQLIWGQLGIILLQRRALLIVVDI